MTHHVVDIVWLNPERRELGLEELAQRVDLQVILPADAWFEQTCLEVEAVDQVIDLLLPYRLWSSPRESAHGA